MIKKETVLILGAGASRGYGLPIGPQLIDNVYDSLLYQPPSRKPIAPVESLNSADAEFEYYDDEDKSSNPLFELLLRDGYHKSQVEKFRSELKSSRMYSIDAFLERRTDYIDIGKKVIAYNLFSRERSEFFDKPSDDWYRLLWSKLNCPKENFKDNKISIVTFNYDRSLEYYLTEAFKSTHGVSWEEAYENISGLRIIHIHGKLGSPKWDSSPVRFEYGYKIKNISQLGEAASCIKIIHEGVEDSPELDLAREILIDAKNIYFLGFGFHEQNIRRLFKRFANHAIEFYSTDVGTEQGERDEKLNLFNELSLGTLTFKTGNCSLFMRNLSF